MNKCFDTGLVTDFSQQKSYFSPTCRKIWIYYECILKHKWFWYHLFDYWSNVKCAAHPTKVVIFPLKCCKQNRLINSKTKPCSFSQIDLKFLCWKSKCQNWLTERLVFVWEGHSGYITSLFMCPSKCFVLSGKNPFDRRLIVVFSS